MLNFKNPQMIHIASEIVVLMAIMMWFTSGKKQMLSQMEKLLLRIEEQEERIQKLERQQFVYQPQIHQQQVHYTPTTPTPKPIRSKTSVVHSPSPSVQNIPVQTPSPSVQNIPVQTPSPSVQQIPVQTPSSSVQQIPVQTPSPVKTPLSPIIEENLDLELEEELKELKEEEEDDDLEIIDLDQLKKSRMK